jgi:hypothetical protein
LAPHARVQLSDRRFLLLLPTASVTECHVPLWQKSTSQLVIVQTSAANEADVVPWHHWFTLPSCTVTLASCACGSAVTGAVIVSTMVRCSARSRTGPGGSLARSFRGTGAEAGVTVRYSSSGERSPRIPYAIPLVPGRELCFDITTGALAGGVPVTSLCSPGAE